MTTDDDGFDGSLILDRLDALRVLRADTPEEKGALLEQLAGTGQAERGIVDELSKVRPLWRPDRFEEAHRMAMRSIEVLDRGARSERRACSGAPPGRRAGAVDLLAGRDEMNR